jgi:starch synthase
VRTHVVHLAAEVAPYARTGGLGDVLAALPRAIARAGTPTSVVLPGHRSALEAAGGVDEVARLWVPVSSGTQEAVVLAVRAATLPTFLVHAPRYFDRPSLYGEWGRDYDDNAERFVFFARAALEWLRTLPVPPSHLHVHDWHAALAPAFLRAGADVYPELASMRTVTTVHNLAHQGRFWGADWHLLNLDRRWFTPAALEFHGGINFLKAGLVFADAITTVSPRYAEEIRTPEFGEGLDGVLRARRDAVHGIVNGADYAVWDPTRDPALAARYSAADLAGKAACKRALQAELGLDVGAERPLLGVVSRLVAQKGIDLVLDVVPELLATTRAALVVLGSGDPGLEEALVRLAARSPRRVAMRLGFDDGLAHRIEAGADLFLMPSRYEPCGLSQLYSLRYGTVPVVHAVGGLVDTVEPYDPVRDRGTGFRFRPFAPAPLLAAIRDALDVWADAPRWTRLVRRAMAVDFSWEGSARRYQALYAAVATAPPAPLPG